jgi:hypothetical protein
MKFTGRLVIALLVAPAVVQAQTITPSDSAKAGDRAQSFLDRPYTVMNHAVEALQGDVNKEADWISSTQNYSKDFFELRSMIFTTSGAYRSAKSGSVIVWIDFGVDRIVGDPATVCSSHLLLLADLIFGHGKDVAGMDMREKKMLFRFGSAVTSDTLGAFAAAKTMLLRAKFHLRITESGAHSQVSCWQDVSTGIVHPGELPDER